MGSDDEMGSVLYTQSTLIHFFPHSELKQTHDLRFYGINTTRQKEILRSLVR